MFTLQFRLHAPIICIVFSAWHQIRDGGVQKNCHRWRFSSHLKERDLINLSLVHLCKARGHFLLQYMSWLMSHWKCHFWYYHSSRKHAFFIFVDRWLCKSFHGSLEKGWPVCKLSLNHVLCCASSCVSAEQRDEEHFLAVSAIPSHVNQKSDWFWNGLEKCLQTILCLPSPPVLMGKLTAVGFISIIKKM